MPYPKNARDKFDEKITDAVSLLAELTDQHGTLTPMVLTLALILYCKHVGQDPQVHLNFGKTWDALQDEKI